MARDGPRLDSALERPEVRRSKIASELVLTLERVTRIELALSAWESVLSGPVAWSGLRISLSASGGERPLVTGVNGSLMARWPLPGWRPEGLGLTSASAIDPTALAARVEASESVQFLDPPQSAGA